MRTVHRERHYVRWGWLTVLRPAFRYSPSRRAYVLRGVGRRMGPVLCVDRRPAKPRDWDGVERRRASVA